MIKRLLIFAVFFTIAQAFVPAIGQASDKSYAATEKEDRSYVSGASRQPAEAVIEEKANDANDQSQSGESRKANPQPAVSITKATAAPEAWAWHDKWLWVANLVLAVVGVGGIIVAILTLFKIERQTKAGETAAKAALLSAQAVINAERPWLLVVIESVKGPMGGFNIFVKNKGRTPAMIVASHIGCVRVEDISHLPTEAPYGVGSMVQDLIVVPDERPLIRWFDGKHIKQMLGDVRLAYWEGRTFIFGKVIYRDLADPTPDRIHETRWIGLYEGPTGEESDSIFQIEGIGTPEEYAKYS
jgi:hypothetical protein